MTYKGVGHRNFWDYDFRKFPRKMYLRALTLMAFFDFTQLSHWISHQNFTMNLVKYFIQMLSPLK